MGKNFYIIISKLFVFKKNFETFVYYTKLEEYLNITCLNINSKILYKN